jgi:hypothetical protein
MMGATVASRRSMMRLSFFTIMLRTSVGAMVPVLIL